MITWHKSIALICICIIPLALYSQSLELDAGESRIIKWQKSLTVQLEGRVNPAGTAIQWSCPANPDVRFDNSSDPTAKVSFPRSGYYLLTLRAEDTDGIKHADTVVINVFKPNTHAQRLNDMINLMTVEEKISQLSNQASAIPHLNIPAYNYWSEALHGVLDRGVTSFPQVVALGSTWDPDLVHRVATVISDEARILNRIRGKGLSYWSPTVNIARDPRWGRNEESYSEDPYLLSSMGVAFVTGMQGSHPYYLKTVSTPKHFIANNEEARRHTGSSDVDMRSLWEYYMPAFERTIVEGKACSIMGAYNELNQVPCCGNDYLLNDVLRRTWGFEGYVVSDCGAIHDMVNGHHYFETGAQAAARGLLSGCDLNCGEYYRNHLHEAIEQGLIDEKDLNRSLKRVLAARFRLGHFDPPENVPYQSIPNEKLDCPAHRDLALEAAQKAIVLLKNEGVLPLNAEKIRSIAVIGPNAEECQLGIYSGWPNSQIGPLEGIKKKAEQYGIEVTYTRGCEIGGGLMKPIEPQYFAEFEDTSRTGMKAEFFSNMNLEGKPVHTRIDSVINFNWGAGVPAPDVPADQFSVRWTGRIFPPETREYALGTRTDDGARLFVDDRLLFEDWTEHGEKPNKGLVRLEKNRPVDIVFEYFDNSLGAVARLTWDLGQKDFEKARRIARDKDAVILVVGTSPGIAEEELDRTDISLPDVQRDLILEVAEVNPNIILVLINGGPVALLDTEPVARAVVEAWYTGQSEGTAIADVLFGDVNPGGKLPETFYASNDQLPPAADYDIINHPRTYLYFNEPVLYPFGHGLSYTTFEYSNIKLGEKKTGPNDVLEIQCKVKNTGARTGDEVVQLYIRDMEASVKVPIRQLKGFRRITLKPGKSRTVRFQLPVSELTFYDIESNKQIVEPGEFEVQIGSSSQDIRLTATFQVE